MDPIARMSGPELGAAMRACRDVLERADALPGDRVRAARSLAPLLAAAAALPDPIHAHIAARRPLSVVEAEMVRIAEELRLHTTLVQVIDRHERDVWPALVAWTRPVWRADTGLFDDTPLGQDGALAAYLEVCRRRDALAIILADYLALARAHGAADEEGDDA